MNPRSLPRSQERTLRSVRFVIVASGIALTVYVLYTVLLVLTINGTLRDAGLDPARSGRWLAQTSLGALFGSFAAFLAARSTYRPGVLTLAGFLLAQGFATGYLNSFAFAGPSADTWYWARALVNWMAYALALRTTQLFPRALEAGRIAGRAVGWVNVLVGPRRVWVVTGMLLAISLLARSDLAFQLGQLMVLAAAVATMAANYREGTTEEREKIYWLLLGGGFLFVARILLVAGRMSIEVAGSLTGAEGPELSVWYGVVRSISWTVANAGLLSCLAMAVFYRGAIDPRLVLRRTAVYSFAVGLAVFLFAMFENYAAEVTADLLGIREGLLEAAAGAALALMLKPLHDGLTRVVEGTLPSTEPPAESSGASMAMGDA